MREFYRHVSVIATVSAAVLLIGRGLASGGGETAVVAGVLVAATVQMAVFGLSGHPTLRGRPFITIGLGMMARMGTVLAAGLILAPALSLPAAATLLATAGVLFLSGLAESLLSLSPPPIRR